MALTLRKILSSLCPVVIFLSAGCAPVYGEEKKAEGVLKGKEIFHERCSACHGVDGVPLLPSAPEFAKGERMEKPDEELLNSVLHGKGEMPPWEETLSVEQCRNVLSYVKLLAGEKVFEDKCHKCHVKGIPELGANIPGNEELKNLPGPIDVCRRCDVEMGMTKDELINVIRYIRTLSK